MRVEKIKIYNLPIIKDEKNQKINCGKLGSEEEIKIPNPPSNFKKIDYLA